MKYIDADRLKEEFQKRFDICKRVSDDDRNALDTQDWYRGKYTAYSECLSFIDSLQREKQEVDLEKAALNFAEEIGVPVSDTFLSIARHFSELGQRKAAEMYDEVEYNRQRVEEEMSDKTLDEVADEYSKRVSDGHNYRDLTCGFIAGAKWMAEQGVTLKVTDDTTWGEVNDFIHRNCDCAKEIQIRKKEESK